MRLTALPFAAIISLLLPTAGQAARRPHYGGILRIEVQDRVANLDPSEASSVLKDKLSGLVYETLVRLDANGEPQPLLATSWIHDVSRRKWIFTVRPNVLLHNSTPWESAPIVIDDRRPIDEILRNLAQPRNAIAVRTADGALAGTGPFRIVKCEPNQQLLLEAHDGYWGGRPYLDQVDVRMGRSLRDQALDFELAKTDAIELPLTDVRRTQQRGAKIAISQPVETLALIFDNPQPELDRVREALALCIDRTAIHSVLLQKQGDISSALLPQWLTGYAFLFDRARDVAQAKELAASAPALTFAYDRQNPLLRSIAERVTLNAAEAGLTLRPAAGNSGDVRLISLRIRSADPRQALEELASSLQTPAVGSVGFDPANLYAMERGLISARRLVPLFQLPVVYELSSQIRGWQGDRWQLQDVWMDARAKP